MSSVLMYNMNFNANTSASCYFIVNTLLSSIINKMAIKFFFQLIHLLGKKKDTSTWSLSSK